MKVNKFLIFILLILLIIELLLTQVLPSNNYEFQLILDLIFVFYFVNKRLFLEEQQYNRNGYILNYNNLWILIFLYLESVHSSNLYIVNVIFIFLIPFILVHENFPDKINVIFVSILILYMSMFFYFKDYLVINLFSKIDMYFNFLTFSNIVINVFINILFVILFSMLFSKKLRVKTKY